MACCRRNRSGRCQNCLCVKSGRLCRGCLPSRLGDCVNIVQSQPSQATTQAPRSSQTDKPLLSSSCSPSMNVLSLSPELFSPPVSPASLHRSRSPITNVPETPPCRSTINLGSRQPIFSPVSPTSLHCSHSPTTNVSETPPYRFAIYPGSQLPTFSPVAEPVFTWGSCDSATTFINSLNATYDEIVHWKPNLFRVPFGRAGKAFVSELATLYRAFATSSAMESIAMKATIVLPILLLQKPSRKSKAKDHSACLERRLSKWHGGDLNDLLLEGRTI